VCNAWYSLYRHNKMIDNVHAMIMFTPMFFSRCGTSARKYRHVMVLAEKLLMHWLLIRMCYTALNIRPVVVLSAKIAPKHEHLAILHVSREAGKHQR